MISGSQVPVLLACPESFAFDQVDYDTEAAAKGTEAHRILALRVESCDIGMPSGSTAEAWQAEHAIALDLSDGTARMLGRVVDRQYSVGPFEIPGAMDAFALEITSERRRGHIVDWKTGMAEVEAPARNAQMLFYAAALARAFELDSVVISIGRTLGKDARDCQPHFESEVVHSLELDAFFVRLREAYNRATRAKLNKSGPRSLRIGPHCLSCKAAACPAQQGMMAQARNGVELTTIGMRKGDAVLELMASVATAKKYQAMATAMLAAIASEGPVDVDGRPWGKYTTVGNEKVDSELASQIMHRRFAPNHLEVNCTKAGVERATKKRGLVGKEAAEYARAVINEFRSIGAMTRTTKTEIGFIPAQQLAGESDEEAA